MRDKYVRWLGAFRKPGINTTLFDSIVYEYGRVDEAAAERVHCNQGHVPAKVGVLVKEDAIFRKFRCDCWSKYQGSHLKATEPHNVSNHNEMWFRCADAVIGIVVKDGISTLKRETQECVIRASNKLGNLPVYCLDRKGNLKREL